MTTQATPAVAAAKTAKERRTWTARYVGAGGKEQFEVRLEHRRDGTWRTFARHVVGTGKARKTARGATGQHATEKEARAAQDRLMDAATKAGWVAKPAHGGGYSAKPDAFTIATLPKATAK